MKINNVRILSGKEQDRMVDNGWWLERANKNETPEELFERLSDTYDKVKVYRTTTYVRGIYRTFAFVK